MKIGWKRYEKKGSTFFKGNIFYTNIVVLKFKFHKRQIQSSPDSNENKKTSKHWKFFLL